MTSYPLKLKALVITTVITISLLTVWEIYCRANGFIATPDNTKALWAENRGKLRDNDPNQVVLTSASRGWFDFQLNEWEALTGVRPIQLGDGGKGPGPVFKDIVENTEFIGTLVINVTPALFFIPPADSVGRWKNVQNRVDYFYDRTYAQQLNHYLSYLLQPYFAFLTSDGQGDPDLKSLIKRINIPGRVKPPRPFPRFLNVDSDRNVTMFKRISEDTAFAAIIQRAWMHNRDSVNKFEYAKSEIFSFYKANIKKFKDRGGKIIFTRNPSHGKLKDNEELINPRKEYWDKFVKEMGCPAYHFEDYPQLNQFFTPEWSHLATPDAKIYTAEIIKLMQKDKVL